MSTLSRLQDWYAGQCNGDWEHSLGIRIESCDNPGWWVKINLVGTRLLGLPFVEIAEGVDSRRHPTESRWLDCHVEDAVWHGAGDDTKLERILEEFLAWAENAQDR